MKTNYILLLITLSFILFMSCSQSQRNNSQNEDLQINKTEDAISISMESIIEEPIETVLPKS